MFITDSTHVEKSQQSPNIYVYMTLQVENFIEVHKYCFLCIYVR